MSRCTSCSSRSSRRWYAAASTLLPEPGRATAVLWGSSRASPCPLPTHQGDSAVHGVVGVPDTAVATHPPTFHSGVWHSTGACTRVGPPAELVSRHASEEGPWFLDLGDDASRAGKRQHSTPSNPIFLGPHTCSFIGPCGLSERHSMKESNGAESHDNSVQRRNQLEAQNPPRQKNTKFTKELGWGDAKLLTRMHIIILSRDYVQFSPFQHTSSCVRSPLASQARCGTHRPRELVSP